MGMSTGGAGGATAAINITPYIDILLVLLIIFMVIQPTMQYDLEARVPQKAPDEIPDNIIVKTDAIVVSIDATGALRINQDPVTSDLLGDRLFEMLYRNAFHRISSP